MNSNGIGLGLTIVKQIVEQSGGKVSVESPGLGRGSKFSIEIPMELAAQEQSNIAEPPAETRPSIVIKSTFSAADKATAYVESRSNSTIKPTSDFFGSPNPIRDDLE